MEKNKQGPALFLTLEGKAREAGLELDITEISGENGIKNITGKLDTLCKKIVLKDEIKINKFQINKMIFQNENK